MGDDHNGAVMAVGEFFQDRLHIRAGGAVEIAGRLVGKDQERSLASARAIATRWLCPPDNCRGSFCA